jgi:hypothetical protein
VPTIPSGIDAVVMTICDGVTVTLKVWEALASAESLTVTATVNFPAVPGAPLMAPFEAPVTPSGKPTTDQRYGGRPLDAARLAE